MGLLTAQFKEQKRRLFQKKHQNSPAWERRRERCVLRFLEFCEKRGRKKIRQIKQEDYDIYIMALKEKGVSDETIRKESLELRRFFERAGLQIQVNPNKGKKRRIKRKMKKIAKVFEHWGIENPEVLEEVEKALW